MTIITLYSRLRFCIHLLFGLYYQNHVIKGNTIVCKSAGLFLTRKFFPKNTPADHLSIITNQQNIYSWLQPHSLSCSVLNGNHLKPVNLTFTKQGVFLLKKQVFFNIVTCNITLGFYVSDTLHFYITSLTSHFADISYYEY